MKTAFLLHGTGGNDTDYYWFEDTKKYLEDKGYQVWWPKLPNTDKPELYETEDYICDNWLGINEETLIIGHSSACPVILDILQWLKIKVDKVILVSGFYKSIDDEGFSELMLPKEEFDYEKIAKHANEIILINSDNDPWGCDDKQARPVAEKLGAKFILAKGQGHMGSGTYNQPYKELPLIKEII